MNWLVTLRFGALNINGPQILFRSIGKTGALKPNLKNQFAICLNYLWDLNVFQAEFVQRPAAAFLAWKSRTD